MLRVCTGPDVKVATVCVATSKSPIRAASVPTVAAGVLEWLALRPSLRVRGLCHGSLGLTTSVLFGVSLLLRIAGRRRTAVVFSALASGTAIAAAHLGGQLVFNHGAGQRESGADENLEGARSS